MTFTFNIYNFRLLFVARTFLTKCLVGKIIREVVSTKSYLIFSAGFVILRKSPIKFRFSRHEKRRKPLFSRSFLLSVCKYTTFFDEKQIGLSAF